MRGSTRTRQTPHRFDSPPRPASGFREGLLRNRYYIVSLQPYRNSEQALGRNRIKYFVALLLSAAVWYQCCTTLFSHTHQVGSHSITHSHPYKGTADNPCHSHTAAQFLTIAMLSAYTALAAMFVSMAALLPETVGRLRPRSCYRTALHLSAAATLRGPPATA